MNRILKAYLKRLTNLSTRNKSLLLTHLAAEQFIDLHEADFLLEKPSIELVRQLVQQKARIAICDVADARFEKVNLASKRIRKISRTEQFIQEERGSRDLFVGYPFVKGKLADGTPIHAPLLFFPVNLKMDREQWCLFPREDSNIVLNQSFALAYSQFNETAVQDEVLEKSFEDFPKDFLEFRTQLYEWLKTTPFKINFNQALFEDKLIAFNAEKAADLVAGERTGELKLYPEAVLGIFPQAGSYLVPDYNRLLENQETDQVSIPLIGEDSGYSEDGSEEIRTILKVREEEILTPFPIDEAQEEILLNIKSGKSVVVQGPPGSGKSQLICNLTADFASRGKRVLVVCQKRAALDVVYQRLQKIGMSDFVALIHDFKNDRSELYRQIALQIEQVEAYRKQNYSLDAVFLERQFTQESRAIDKSVLELNAFRDALFDEKEAGVSIKELYLTSDQRAARISAASRYKFFRLDSWDHFRRQLRTYCEYCMHIPPQHDWAARRNFADFGIAELRSMEQMLGDWPEAFEKQQTKFAQLTGIPFSPKYIQNRAEVQERLGDIMELVANQNAWNLFRKYMASPAGTHERLAFIRQTGDSLEGFLQEDGIEFSLDKSELNAFIVSLRKAIDSKESAVSGFFWDVFGKEKKEIGKVAQANGLTLSLDDLRKLQVKLRNRQELEGWLNHESLAYNAAAFHLNQDPGRVILQFFKDAEAAADAVVRANFAPWTELFSQVTLSTTELAQFELTLRNLRQWLATWDRMERGMLPYLLPQQITRLVDQPAAYAANLLGSLSRDFDSMVDMDRLLASMSEVEQEVTTSTISESKKLGLADPGEMVNLFENSIKLAWIEHIETKYPQLRAVTSLKMNQLETQLQDSIYKKQQLSIDINAIKLREGTYGDIEKNRLGNTVTYRELGHQVTKKRKIWPIRKLMESYSDEVFSLVPCWMASPEAVSAIFPMQKDLFDLVIFDEASQCYAEYGLPAAFRGKQLVVTGDSKQLPPSDLYKVRYEDRGEEDEYAAAIEIESLLDLAAQSLDQFQLTGHYRSQSLDLIDFSNRHFYKSTLRLLPEFGDVNSSQPGIHYIKTEGIWKNNTNAAEVGKVVELARELAGSGKSLGIVTFNFYQQAAILDALEKENISIPDLFVKNIENVQGDERDVIIFSMGYAPDENGKLSMQFGSLNMQGGENRLNVAVTRARERIYFVTSLWPAQLQTEQTANAGPKMLKAYLEYALEVSESRYSPAPAPTRQFRTDWLLKERVTRLNPNYRKELPFGDITVKEEGAYKGLILTDDDLYHESKSSKEPHAYLPLLLRLKNWPFRRVYSREYWSGTLGSDLL